MVETTATLPRTIRFDVEDLKVLEGNAENFSQLVRDLVHSYVIDIRNTPDQIPKVSQARPVRLVDRIVWSPWFEGSLIALLVGSVLSLIGATIWFYGLGPLALSP